MSMFFVTDSDGFDRFHLKTSKNVEKVAGDAPYGMGLPLLSLTKDCFICFGSIDEAAAFYPVSSYTRLPNVAIWEVEGEVIGAVGGLILCSKITPMECYDPPEWLWRTATLNAVLFHTALALIRNIAISYGDRVFVPAIIDRLTALDEYERAGAVSADMASEADDLIAALSSLLVKLKDEAAWDRKPELKALLTPVSVMATAAEVVKGVTISMFQANHAANVSEIQSRFAHEKLCTLLRDPRAIEVLDVKIKSEIFDPEGEYPIISDALATALSYCGVR